MTVQELIYSYRADLLKNHSKITAKNYISDINHFITWFAKKYNKEFCPDLLSKTVIDDYKYSLGLINDSQSATLSYKSFKRHLSSIKSFSSFIHNEGLLSTNPFHEENQKHENDLWKLSVFKNNLIEAKASDLTIKYYINDIKSFTTWCENTALIKPDERFSNITASLVFEYVSRLKTNSGLSPRSINRKLSSLRRYLNFITAESNSIFSQDVSFAQNVQVEPSESLSIAELKIEPAVSSYSSIPPLRLAQRIGNLYLNFESKTADLITSKIVSTRLRKLATPTSKYIEVDKIIAGLSGKRIKKEFYAPYSISTSSFPVYKKLLFHAKYTRPNWYKKYHTYPLVHYVHLSVLVIFAVGVSIYLYNNTLGLAGAESFARPQGKTFIFKGKLLDKNGNPVTSSTNISLALYDSPTGKESSPLWKEDQTNIAPDPSGNVNLTAGRINQIPDSLFEQNTPLYLGIRVGNDAELEPRQQIGVPFANSAQNVQGLVPITNSDKQENVLLALDSGGNLTIGGSASPVFQSTGGDFTLQGQSLVLNTNPSSNGDIILHPDGIGKVDVLAPITSSTGKINIQGVFAVEATSSTQSAVSINQFGAGSFLTASTAGITKFNIDNQGVITKGVWSGEVIGTAFGGFGASITAAGPGEILYSTSPTTYGHLTPGAAGDCLISNGRDTPLWSSCGFFKQLGGTIALTNNTLDLLLGGTSTSSARFSFTNMNSGNPTFKIGSSLSFSSDNLIEAISSDLKIGGYSTKNILLASSGGNVGVGNNSPTRTLDVNGSFGGNVDYYSDGAGNNNIERSKPAMVYDLEKNTGGSDTSSTTTFDITGLPDTDGTIAYIYTKVSKTSTLSSQSQTLILKINGVQLSSISTPNSANSESTIKHYTAIRSNSAWHLLGSYGDSDNADLAEWIEAEGKVPESGSLLSINSNGKVIKSQNAHDSKLAGIVSTNPNIVIGPHTSNSVRLALSGRIPAIVSSLSGEIKEGDLVTSSPIPGIGMRPEVNSAVVGKALEGFMPNDSKCKEVDNIDNILWPDDSGDNNLKPCFKVQINNLPENIRYIILDNYGLTPVDYIYIGKIMVLANLSWSSSEDLLASIDSATVANDEPLSTFSVDSNFAELTREINSINPTVKTAHKTVKSIAAFGGIVVGKIKSGSVIAVNIASQNLLAAKGVIDDLSSNNITAKRSITSPLASIDQIKTDTISPNKSNNVAINLKEKDSALVVSTEGKEVAKIDNEGNISSDGNVAAHSASFSGQLTASDASVSGTLRAGNILADSISGLDEKVSTIAAQLITNTQNLKNDPIPQLSEYFARDTVSAKFGTFQEGLMSLGASTFGDISVMNNLSVGTTLVFTNNSVNTLGTDLNIQPLRQGAVSFLAGAVRIEADGRLVVSEDAEFKKNLAVKGKLYAGVISPVGEEDLNIELDGNNSLAIKNSSGSATFRVNSKGDIAASGSARFAKLNLNLVEQAYALDSNTAAASSSAGTAYIKASSKDITIFDPLVTANSLIYITPANNTNNNVMFLMRQTAEDENQQGVQGSFTVGVSTPVSQDTLFNWLIVN